MYLKNDLHMTIAIGRYDLSGNHFIYKLITVYVDYFNTTHRKSAKTPELTETNSFC